MRLKTNLLIRADNPQALKRLSPPRSERENDIISDPHNVGRALGQNGQLCSFPLAEGFNKQTGETFRELSEVMLRASDHRHWDNALENKMLQ